MKTNKLKIAELKKIEKILTTEREKISKDLQYESNQIAKTQTDSSGDLSDYSYHMGDQGTETERREVTSHMLSAQREALFEIDLALRKITKGTYGICERCGKPIQKKRLKFLPQARLCVKCANAK